MDIPEITQALSTLDRPEETDLRVLACAAGVDRLSRANMLTPYETTVAMKLALRAILKNTRAPMAMIHQMRGLLNELEAEQEWHTKPQSHEEDISDTGVSASVAS